MKNAIEGLILGETLGAFMQVAKAIKASARFRKLTARFRKRRARKRRARKRRARKRRAGAKKPGLTIEDVSKGGDDAGGAAGKEAEARKESRAPSEAEYIAGDASRLKSVNRFRKDRLKAERAVESLGEIKVGGFERLAQKLSEIQDTWKQTPSGPGKSTGNPAKIALSIISG